MSKVQPFEHIARIIRTQICVLEAIAEAIATPVDSALNPDALVAFPFGLEARTARALVNSGELRSRKIGRKTYALATDLAALVMNAPAKPSAPVPADSYRALVAKARGRR